MQPRGGEESLIPQPRGSLPTWCAFALAAMTTIFMWLHASNDLIGLIALAMLILTIGPALHGVCLLAEEVLHHRTTRWRYLFQVVFGCLGKRTLEGLAIACLLSVLTPGTSQQGNLWRLVILACALYPLLKTLGVLGPCEVELSEVCEGRKMNVAHGLAWSFYLGYLKLVLPTFRSSHLDDPFRARGFKKLLILIPLNANIAHKLEDEDTNIRFYDNLSNQKIDRGGVKGRVYKHSIYTVLDDMGQGQECVMEYATPLLTLHSMSQDSRAGFGERDRKDQVLLFYRTLRDILEDSLECRNLYTLILLNDEHEEDPHFLSKTILKHLQQAQTEEFCINPQEVGYQFEPMSKEPTLMISSDEPQPLREPMENTFNFVKCNAS